VDWICQKAEIDEKEYYRLSQVNQEKLRIMSLNHLISDNGEDQLADILPDTRQSLQAIVDNDFLREDLHKQLHHRLTEREAKVIIERFDLDCQGQRTLQEIGQEMGVTKERIRQIEKQAINKLRDIGGLRDYFLNN
jgi:DNA-directed RNA polymerase, sigma subunit (sigma70/sigma32)